MNVDKTMSPNTKISSPERVPKHAQVVSRTNNVPDDLDVMMLHEDFQALICLAAKAKETRQKIQALAGQNYNLPNVPATKLPPEQICQIVDKLREVHVSNGVARAPILRGQYPVTDSLIEDMMVDLQNDHERGEQWLNQFAKKPKSSGIAQKYSKWQTDILMNWMIDNVQSPFPDDKNVEKLSQMTGLSNSQVVNWTTNVRKRNRKATCEGSKKPHHFIDFLFLVSDRETKNGIPPSRKRQQSGPLLTNSKPPPQAVPIMDTTTPIEPVKLLRETSLHCAEITEPDECISKDIFDDVAFQGFPGASNLGEATLDDFVPAPHFDISKEHCDSTDNILQGTASFDLMEDISQEELESLAESMKMEI